MDLYVPACQYHRPDGRREDGIISIPGAYTDHRGQQLRLMDSEELFFTVEKIPGGLINVCLDDGDFDYKFELVSHRDDAMHTALLNIIDEFDVDDYRKAAEDNTVFDEEGL